MNLDGFFYPRSIAVIGVSRKEGSLGRVFFDTLVKFQFKGKIYPVNPKTDEINGIACYSSIDKLPEIPDLAVIMVRKELALEAVEACGKKGIPNIVMITAGFKEIGGEGFKREEKLRQLVQKYQMKMIGPNCMGIINTDPEVNLNASFSPTEPYIGNVAFISQSGALGVAVLEMCKALHIGFSIFISVGNKADLTDNDFIEYLETHQPTEVITLYQESIEDPVQFRKVTTKLSRKKPIIALRAGRSARGAKAAASHTGAMASSELAAEALFKQCGILRANSISELFEYVLAFSSQRIPKGNRIAVITNAGGPAILATDAIEYNNLRMAQLNERTQKRLREFLPAEASVYNPVDMLASASENTYQQALKIVLADENVDAIMIIIVRPPVNTTPRMIAEKFKEILLNKKNKPIFIVLMADRDPDCGLEIFQELKLPVYAYPESAARSIAKMLKYKEWKEKPAGKIQKFQLNKNNLDHIFVQASAEGREYLRSQEILTILETYGFPIPQSVLVQSPQEAIQFRKTVGGPIVLKVESDEIIHKSDIGGVQVNLNDPEEIQEAFGAILNNAAKVTKADRILGILVQEMVQGACEVALERNDPRDTWFSYFTRRSRQQWG